jgi:hypothetical protein
MIAWADLEIDAWAGPEAIPTVAHPPATARPPAPVVARAAVALVCRVCGRPWLDGACSFMPEQHARWGPIAR